MKKIVKSIKKRGLLLTVIRCIGSPFYCIFRKVFFDAYLNNLKISDNMVLFDSFPDYSDNAKAYFDYLVKNKRNYKYVWLVQEKSKYKNTKNVLFVKKESKFHGGYTLKALYYSSICGQIFFTHGSPKSTLKIKDNQIVVNLWHGCGYKKNSNSSKSFVESNYFDVVLVPGPVFVKTKTDFFGCNSKQVLPLGYPRYDLLLNEDDRTKKVLDKISGNNKVIIWMPTFQKTKSNDYPEESLNKNYDLPLLNSNQELIELNNICKRDNVTIIIKRHPYQLSYEAEKLRLSNIVFISNEDLVKMNLDLYSILRYTSALITDYSSIAIDYLLLDKPIGFTLSDYDDYKNARGFVFENPLNYMPGNHIYNKDDLFSFVLNVINGEDLHKKDRKKIFSQVHNACNNYCLKIENEIDNIRRKG